MSDLHAASMRVTTLSYVSILAHIIADVSVYARGQRSEYLCQAGRPSIIVMPVGDGVATVRVSLMPAAE